MRTSAPKAARQLRDALIVGGDDHLARAERRARSYTHWIIGLPASISSALPGSRVEP